MLMSGQHTACVGIITLLLLSLLLPYYFLIMCPWLPYYFLIISSLCPHDYPIMYLPITLWLFNITMENCSFIDGLPGFSY